MMDDDVKGTKPNLDKDGGAKHDTNTVDDEANKESTFQIIELPMCWLRYSLFICIYVRVKANSVLHFIYLTIRTSALIINNL